ncbi:MAG: LamG domain-containing protein [Dinghuibacter sp.]|nr:LamG domain-containing protein [Dinghuibacter sp.]
MLNKRSLIFFALFFITQARAQERSIRFFGNGVAAPGADRIKIALTPTTPVNLSGNFTIECFIKCQSANNNGTVTAQANGDGWITGNVFLDRDVYGNGDFGDYGFAIGTGSGVPPAQRVVAFGIDRLGSGITLRGSRNVADNAWHHIAVTRNSSTGAIQLFVDGVPDATGIGPTGNIQYNTARSTAYPNSDPFIVLGAEKHDAGAAYPSFNGQMDELRFSNNIRYTAGFTPPAAMFIADAQTVALYHFNEGSGSTANDVSGAAGGPSHGLLHSGGSPAGPVWLNDSPFSGALFLNWLHINVQYDVNRHNRVSWITTNSSPQTVYEVERSAGGGVFSIIGRVNGCGNFNTNCVYTFTDNLPLPGRNIYRVKAKSITGEISFSPVVRTEPVTNSYIQVTEQGKTWLARTDMPVSGMVLYNSRGMRVFTGEKIIPGLYMVQQPAMAGVYILHIVLANGERVTQKLLHTLRH